MVNGQHSRTRGKEERNRARRAPLARRRGRGAGGEGMNHYSYWLAERSVDFETKAHRQKSIASSSMFYVLTPVL